MSMESNSLKALLFCAFERISFHKAQKSCSGWSIHYFVRQMYQVMVGSEPHHPIHVKTVAQDLGLLKVVVASKVGQVGE